MEEYATISVDELVFYDGNGDSWDHFPKEPTKGVVGCFSYDRIPEYDLFVVISYDRDTDMIKAIKPRIRYKETVELGQDRLTEKNNPDLYVDIKCKCESYFGCDGFCGCGYVDTLRERYANTFEPVETGTYKVVEFKHKISCYKNGYIEFMKKENLYKLDVPIN